jgi:hypothetical protein
VKLRGQIAQSSVSSVVLPPSRSKERNPSPLPFPSLPPSFFSALIATIPTQFFHKHRSYVKTHSTSFASLPSSHKSVTPLCPSGCDLTARVIHFIFFVTLSMSTGFLLLSLHASHSPEFLPLRSLTHILFPSLPSFLFVPSVHPNALLLQSRCKQTQRPFGMCSTRSILMWNLWPQRNLLSPPTAAVNPFSCQFPPTAAVCQDTWRRRRSRYAAFSARFTRSVPFNPVLYPSFSEKIA